MSENWRNAKLRPRAQIFLWRHGWIWVAALLAAIVAFGIRAAWLEPARAKLAAARAELALASAALPAPAAAPTEQQQLAQVQSVLRASATPPQLLREMAALAQAQQIVLQQAEYQQQLHPVTQVLQVQVSHPVRATYPQLRRYIESVLRARPNVSLDQVAARRDSVGQSQLEVRLRWSFWLQAPTDRAPAESVGRSGS